MPSPLQMRFLNPEGKGPKATAIDRIPATGANAGIQLSVK